MRTKKRDGFSSSSSLHRPSTSDDDSDNHGDDYEPMSAVAAITGLSCDSIRDSKKKQQQQHQHQHDISSSSCSLRRIPSYPPLFQLCIPAVGFLFMTILAMTLPKTGQDTAPVRVAFIGNSITFVNDIPRLVETLAQGRIEQDSCLHGSLNLMTLLKKGNGMYHKWQTHNAFIEHYRDDEGEDDYDYDDDGGGGGGDILIYDFGACSVPQLLLGHDMNLYSDTFMVDDGRNPCLQDQHYLEYRESLYTTTNTTRDDDDDDDREQQQQEESVEVVNTQPHWDYVVMNDQTQYPASFERRRRSILVLKQVYAPLLIETGAVPVFLVTHGFSTPNRNASLGDIPTFTSHLYHGYRQYVQALSQKLPKRQQPRMAQAGLAFLTLYEEDYDLWKKLFFVDGFHPSPHGSYLIGCVLYATIFHRMPPSTLTPKNYSSSSDTPEASYLFANARKMQLGSASSSPTMPLPTALELRSLQRVCRRVALQNHMPSSLLSYQETQALEAELLDDKSGTWYHTDTIDYYNFNDDDDDFYQEQEEAAADEEAYDDDAYSNLDDDDDQDGDDNRNGNDE